jgi:hypothetical protein
MRGVRALIASVVAIAACSSGSPQPVPVPEPRPPDSAPPRPTARAPQGDAEESALSSREARVMARTLAKVSELRGVRASRPVRGVKLDRERLVARVREKALREYPAEALRREGQLLQLFGFAPPSFDYVNAMMTLLEAQLEGFYEPKNGTMYLAADLKGKEAAATLAHELVHALQDQNWDLKSRSMYRPGKGDETLALACLAEGDATSLMMDFVMVEQGRTALDVKDDVLLALMQHSINAANVENVPHILRTTLIAPYADGLAFVHTLRRKGGWPMVDRVWEKPPVSTEQVLHLEKWEQGEPPIAVAAPTSNALGPDWKLDDEDTFGELGLALTFEEWIDTKDARVAAADWGGDRSAVYRKGNEIAFIVHSRYDAAPNRPEAYSERAFAKLAPGLKRKLGQPTIDTADTLCFDRTELGPLLFARRARDLVIAAGPARNAKGVWASTSTCTQSKKWSDEVLASSPR